MIYTIKDLEVFTNMPFVVLVKDEEGRYVWCNKLWLERAGIGSLDDAIGKNDYEMIWAEHAEELRKNDKEVLEAGKPLNIEEHVKLTGKGEVSGYTCKFPISIEGRRCVMGISVLLDK